MDGQANSAPVAADDVVQFLVDNPDADRADDEEELQSPADESPDEETDESETEDDGPDEDGEDADQQPDPNSQRKIKVTVKGDDGADLTQEVTEKELIAGYQRHADYTRKTQELSRREEHALNVVQTQVSNAQNHYMQRTQLAHAAVARLAGLKSPEEMSVLAQTDPASYVAEQARANQVQAVMAGLENEWKQAQFQQQQQQQAEMQKAFSRCWGVIGQKGIDRPKLERIFTTISKDYGVDPARFDNLTDPSLVMIMNDAVAYRELQNKKAEVTKKVGNAPRLPQRQTVPRDDSASKRQESRLRSGKGNKHDLAAFIARYDL